jgi:outer membrane murein-binding lipoprotein Lpp
MNKFTLVAAAAATGLALAGCDSQAENEVEQQAEAIDEAYEADADLEEAMTDGGPDEEAGEARADQMRKTGEETKDELENMADEMDETPQ